MDPAAILCTEIAQRGLAHIAASEMAAILRAAGLTLTGGAKQAVDRHFDTLRTLGADIR